jgi:glycosyltransferase involved in cell wall biosynthesis
MIDIAIVTYNQELFIGTAISSALAQKTTFPFRLVIGEDFSTDNTREICIRFANEHPDKIKLILNDQNLGLVKNYQNVFTECKAKYLAILEGDDFWIDEFKLQKSFEILENDESVGLVHAKYSILTKGTLKNYVFPLHAKLYGKVYNELIMGNFIGPLTICARKNLIDIFFDFNTMIKQNYETIDYALWLELSYHSQIAFIPEIVAVYRKEVGSISVPGDLSKIEKFSETIFKTLKYFEDKYKTDKHSVRIAINSLNFDLMLKSIFYNDIKKVKFYNKKCFPDGFINLIKWLLAKFEFGIYAGKFFKIFG